MENPSVNNFSLRQSTSRLGNRRTRTSLDRAGWVEGAVDVLANEGFGGLRVEVLAKSFGVTKGSFYWHFKDRQDLLMAVIEHWREGRLRDIEKQTSALPGKENDQLLSVIEIYSASRNRKGMAIELAVRDWAQRDPDVAKVVEEVDLYRLECTRRLFVTCGLSEAEAKSRSVLLYAYVFGQSLMFSENFDNDTGALKKRIAERIAGL